MRGRCYNKNNINYDRYGGRGISICKRWDSFENFHSDMGDPPDGFTLDRVNNNGNYEPNNCRWATRKVQANNKENNHYESLDGETLTISQWSEKTGISESVIHRRLGSGWTFEESVKTVVAPAQKVIKYKDQEKTVKEWSIYLNIPTYIIRNRLNCCKWSIEKTLETPYNE